MKVAVSSEADETNSMSEWPDGVAQWSDQWPAIPGGRVGQTDTRMGAQRRMDGRPSGADRYLTEGARVLDGGRTGARRRAHGCPTESAMDGPTREYIRAVGPRFWAFSSNAQSHLQEMRMRRVLMSESVF
jgi:hypothetical protein